MNILILNWRDIKNPSSGGAEILTQEIAKRFVKWGHQVTQFSSCFPNCLAEEKVDGVKIIRRGHPDARYLFKSVHFLAFWYYLKNFRGKFDVIIDEVHGLPFFTPWYVKEKKVALICEVAGELWKKTFGPIFGTVGLATEKFYFHAVYRDIPYLTISPSTEKDLIRSGVQKNKITVLPMGINVPDMAKTFKKEPRPTLLFTGRLTEPKGIEDAIRVLGKVNKKNPKSRLWVIGRGDKQYVDYLKKLSKKLNVYDKITFFGFVSEKKKFTLMAKAHILIHTSIREGFGLTIPEAGHMGTPVIGYNSPGIRDIIKPGQNGILLQQNSPRFLAREAIFLLRDKKRYEKMSRQARLEARKYNWDNTARTAFSILERL